MVWSGGVVWWYGVGFCGVVWWCGFVEWGVLVWCFGVVVQCAGGAVCKVNNSVQYCVSVSMFMSVCLCMLIHVGVSMWVCPCGCDLWVCPCGCVHVGVTCGCVHVGVSSKVITILVSFVNLLHWSNPIQHCRLTVLHR